jgi:hypothetical protein
MHHEYYLIDLLKLLKDPLSFFDVPWRKPLQIIENEVVVHLIFVSVVFVLSQRLPHPEPE